MRVIGYWQINVLRCRPATLHPKHQTRFHFDSETDGFLLTRIQTGQDRVEHRRRSQHIKPPTRGLELFLYGKGMITHPNKGEFSVGVRNSEKIALCDPVMPVADSFHG